MDQFAMTAGRIELKISFFASFPEPSQPASETAEQRAVPSACRGQCGQI